jgi:biopolymer transport protein ExbD
VINLVPFIDLLSCCIAFLLITAVWSQVANIDVRTAGPGGDAGGGAPMPTLWIGERDCELRLPGGVTVAIEPAALPATLRARRGDGEALLVEPADAVRYERLVAALDAARAAGYVSLSVSNGF